MPLPEVGQPFVPQSAAEVRDAILSDIRFETLNLTGTEPAVQPGTDDHIFATAHGNAAMLQYASIESERGQITPLNASGERLEEWRKSLGLPFVGASPASGKLRVTVQQGSVTISDGQQWVYPNGLRGKVSGHHSGVTDGGLVDVIAIDTGSNTNAEGGVKVRFVSPPNNVATEAEVSSDSPLTGGFDEEDDPRKRTRVQNALANKPGGGSWAQYRQVALDELASVQDCFVYPAPGGPSSVLVVPVRDFDVERNEYTRAMNTAALNVLQNAIFGNMSDAVENVVVASQDQETDATISVQIPDSVQSGGDGGGWLDLAPWPPLVAADAGRVTVTTFTSSRQVTVSANTATAPVAGVTRIAWWSRVDRRFRQFLVTAVSGSAGAWVLTLDRPMTDSEGIAVQTTDYICPAAANMEAYGKAWVDVFRTLGPGEITTDVNRIPRSSRHPRIQDESPVDLGFLVLKDLGNKFNEIRSIAYEHRSTTTPTIPNSVDSPPRILVPLRFAVYKAT